VLSGAPGTAPVTASQRVTVGPEVERRHVLVIRTVTLGRETARRRAAAHGRWLVPVAGVLGAGLAHPERVDPEIIAPEVIVAGIVVLDATVVETTVLEATVLEAAGLAATVPEAAVTVAIGPVLEITVVGPVLPVPRGQRG
jgi:hypothetical protein